MREPDPKSKRSTTTIAGLAATIVVIASSAFTNTAMAADDPTSCAQKPVSARGEPSKFKWLARTKTRANWRQKVRAITGLGDPYANWKRAADAKEYCVTGPNGVTCEFVGIPCKKASN